MESPSTQPSLLLRIRDATDHAAWREFDARYGDLVIGYCRSCGLQLSDAEDVRQLVMMNLSKSIGGFEYRPELGRFRDYFRRVVRTAIARQVTRHNAREVALETQVLESVHKPTGEIDEQWEEQWIRHHCRRALRELRQTFGHRSVDVFDRLLLGESHEAVAREFDMTQEGVRKIKQRAKDRLREIVSRQIREEDGDV